MPLIETQLLRHSYRTGNSLVWAVDGMSLAIKSGEFVAVMGPSGSGKSTFLYLLGCLASPTAGSYRLDGVDVSRLGPNALAAIRSKKLGFVFQNFNLLPRMTALENVQVPLLYAGMNGSECHRRAEAALDELGLAGLAHRTPAKLSGGEQQRVAIARALVNDPLVLLADEPTGALDTATSKEIMSIFTRLNRERKLTLLLVTHEPQIAAFAERIVTIRDGRVVADERPARKQRRSRRVQRSPPHAAV
jgi:putative ABC transport system ATP-binding protein